MAAIIQKVLHLLSVEYHVDLKPYVGFIKKGMISQLLGIQKMSNFFKIIVQ
jgi:hypothetical protein